MLFQLINVFQFIMFMRNKIDTYRYQFALCSKPIEEKDLKPGDLIFYEATYHDEKRKRQHFDITHIEIFLGDDPSKPKKTIGSRWKQVVSLHDTYELGTDEFPSQLWKVKKFHFFSLEEWINPKYHPDYPNVPEFNPALKEAYDLFAVMAPVTLSKSVFYTGADDGGEGVQSAED